jgi:hypothetical protein
MRPSQALAEHRSRIREIALKHRVKNVRVFGSVRSGNDTEGSDLDLLVDPTAETTLFDLGAICHELEELLGFKVDVTTPNALPPRWRSKVLQEAEPL